MKRALAITVAAIMVLVLIPATALAAGDETLTVGSGGTYATIQAALNAISTDAGTKTIEIAAGTYDETVAILQKPNVNIILQGETGVVFTGNIFVDGGGRLNDSDKLTIKNIVFDKSGGSYDSSKVYIIDFKPQSGVGYGYAHNVTIEDCTFKGCIDSATGNYCYFGVNAGSSGHQAKNTVIRNCTFNQIDCMVQARCAGLTLENVTGTEVHGGINGLNSSNITMTNVVIDTILKAGAGKTEVVLRLGENATGVTDNGYVNITNCRLTCHSSGEQDGVIVLRSNAQAAIMITSSDILGNIVNLSPNTVTLTADNVYWGIGSRITGLSEDQMFISNNAAAPHTCPTSGETEVTVGVDPTYTIVIPAAVNMGTLQKDTGLQSKAFDVKAQDVVIEEGRHIVVSVASPSGFKLASGGIRLGYQLFNGGASALASGGTFANFGGNGTQNGSVQVDTGLIEKAGSYQDTMTFTIVYQ